MNLCKCLKLTFNVVQGQSLRYYAFKSYLKIKWVRPQKIPCISPEKSGDVGKLESIDPNEIILDYQPSKELQTAEPVVKSLFQLKNNPRYHTSRIQREVLIKEVQRHSLDYGSMEVKIAKMTSTIRCLQEYMDEFPRNRKRKVILKELIEKRKKYLKFLRRYDYRRFEWLLEKLDLVYKPPPAEFHWITRKESLQKLTDKYCEEIKNERLNAYRKTLEAQLISFLEEKMNTLEFIRKEQENIGIPNTVETEIEKTEKELKELKDRRNQIEKAEENSSEC